MKKVYLIAIVVALVAGCATYIFAQELRDKTEMTITDAASTSVYVAKEGVDVPEGTLLDQETFGNYFETKNVPDEFLVNGYLTTDTISQYYGSLTASTVYAGNQLSSNNIVDSENAAVKLSTVLNEGEVAYSIQASGEAGVDGYINVGDTIDILTKKIEVNENSDGNTSDETSYEIFMENLEVLKIATRQEVNENEEVVTYSSITLRLKDKDTALELMKMEEESSGTFKMILNHRAEEETEAADTSKDKEDK